METSPYCLQYYEVQVGTVRGVECRYVLGEVDAYFIEMQARTAWFDELFTPDENPPNQTLVTAVVRLAAWAHGEWVRIHPFANGNGRTARLLTN